MNWPGIPLRARMRLPRFRAKNFSTCTRSPTARGSSHASHSPWDDVAFSSTERDRHLGIRPVSQLNTWPVVSPVNASRRPSRDAVHHSGSGRLARPSPWGTFTSYSLPASWRTPLRVKAPVWPFANHFRSTLINGHLRPARLVRLAPTAILTGRAELGVLACTRSQSDVATIKSPTHSGTTAFALSSEKSAGTSNLPVCRSYRQRQPFTTPVCMGLRPLTSASPDRAIRR